MAEACPNENVPDKDTEKWRWESNSHHLRFSRARQQTFYTDVVFKVGGGQLVEFSAHKIFLAISSPVFEAMFYKSRGENESPIVLTDIEPAVFEMLLRYVYGEAIAFRSIPFAGKIYLAADKYIMHGLRSVVQNYIFWETGKDEKYLDIPFYKNLFLDFFKNNASCLLKSKLFQTLSYEVVELLLKMDAMKVKEYDLLMGICRWGVVTPVPENPLLKIKLPRLLGHIRFSNISFDEFTNFLDEFPKLLSWNDTTTIFKHLFMHEYKLPAWCCTDTRQRNSKMYF